MQAMPPQSEVLAEMTAWANSRPEIRALLLTSSRVRPAAPIDAFSDYDLILVVADEFRRDWEAPWLYDYGEPMVRWGDEGEVLGEATSFRSVIYQDGVKIDYTLWRVTLLKRISESRALPEELDAGYQVLLDKDGAAAEWKPPTYAAYIPSPPTVEEYRVLVEEFWWVATYVAKSLWRDEIPFARWVLTADIRDGSLRRMLEWRIEIDHGWAVRPGVHGRGLKALLPPDLWAELSASYVENDWDALWRTATLFRRAARETANALGFAYPQSVDDDVSAFLREMQKMPSGTERC